MATTKRYAVKLDALEGLGISIPLKPINEKVRRGRPKGKRIDPESHLKMQRLAQLLKLVDRIKKLEEHIRKIERELEKQDLLKKQILVLFKSILDCSHNRRVKISEVLDMMHRFVISTPDDGHIQPIDNSEPEDTDLVANLIKNANRD